MSDIKTRIDRLQRELDLLKKQVNEDLLLCTKEELFRLATAGASEEYRLCGWTISEVSINNNTNSIALRGACEISVTLVKEIKGILHTLRGMWVTGDNPGILIIDKNRTFYSVR